MTLYFKDSGLCRECREEFKDGEVAVRSARGGFVHWAFCPVERGKLAVHHIDGNPANNDLSNLRLVTLPQNL